ncbi:MAG: D-TA family PLP-dependent enzyme, partial [Pirellulaceae bacterium]|nr:D-TA family PLP-dependent enzyme [Pirellulaceae bacterium]
MNNPIDWIEVTNLQQIDSPGLIVDFDRVERNIARMVAMVDGNADRLRPHVKTHKMPDVIQMQLDAGIKRFKVATLAEAEMVAIAGGTDILLAHQVVGPKVDRLYRLVQAHREASFAAIVDDPDIATAIANQFSSDALPLRLYVDVDCGMQRTGIRLG